MNALRLHFICRLPGRMRDSLLEWNGKVGKVVSHTPWWPPPSLNLRKQTNLIFQQNRCRRCRRRRRRWLLWKGLGEKVGLLVGLAFVRLPELKLN